MPGVLVYDTNNSGGSWWLSTKDWEALEAEGWTVHWGDRRSVIYGDNLDAILAPVERRGNTWLGAEATTAAKRVESAAEGIAEWERVTNCCAGDLGCNCCGPPHSFTYHSDAGEKRYIGPAEPSSAPLSDVGFD